MGIKVVETELTYRDDSLSFDHLPLHLAGQYVKRTSSSSTKNLFVSNINMNIFPVGLVKVQKQMKPLLVQMKKDHETFYINNFTEFCCFTTVRKKILIYSISITSDLPLALAQL